jgi:rare lipoprotein A (peptidoglycan hydrolase)
MTVMRIVRLTYTPLLVLFASAACTLALWATPAASALASRTSGTSSASGMSSASGASGGVTGGASATSSTPGVAHKQKTSIATWFGPGMYGRQTACGQTLTPAVVGVANRTLPCGTLVQISYGGHAIVVPVLDRGPYAHGANWDLTAGAAQALDIAETVRIATRVVGSTPNTPTLGLPPVTPAESATGGAQASG